MRLARLDHLVLATPDLDATAARFAALTGVEPASGGRHPGWGTANRLVDLTGGAYLELIGPDPEQGAPEGPRPFGIDDLRRPRLVTWALRTTDIAQAVHAAEGRVPLGPVTAMSRRSPDGEVVDWQLTYDPKAPGDGVVPFLIDWGASRHPTDRGLPATPLQSLTLMTPGAAAVDAALAALGVAAAVSPAMTAGLVAVVRGRCGAVTLS